jgi:uncharacterized membrane protein YgdD (TMEM256/DUF423 family)
MQWYPKIPTHNFWQRWCVWMIFFVGASLLAGRILRATPEIAEKTEILATIGGVGLALGWLVLLWQRLRKKDD